MKILYHIILKILLVAVLFLPLEISAQGNTCTTWDIIDGDMTLDNNFWDPDGDGDICVTCAIPNNGNEGLDLNPLSNSITGWVKISGSDPVGDPVTAGNCGNSDIVDDSDGGDYAYYNIIDKDGSPDSGDERLAFAVRIGDRVSGNFGFSFLLNADGPCSTDANALCGNPCFEYEIQLNTNSQEVEAYDVDGCYGCDNLNLCGASACNANALQVCMNNSACADQTNSVMWFFYIDIADLNGTVPVTSSNGASLVPVTATSSNGVINKATNISDVGGIDDDAPPCPECVVPPGCSASPYCDLLCSSENTPPIPLPIELLDFSAESNGSEVLLSWLVASQVDNERFVIEKSTNGRDFAELGSIPGELFSNTTIKYQMIDRYPVNGSNYYRLRQINTDGTFTISDIRVVKMDVENQVQVYPSVIDNEVNISFGENRYGRTDISILDASGKLVYSKSFAEVNSFESKRIDFNNLPSGIYFLNIQTETGYSNHKLFKR